VNGLEAFFDNTAVEIALKSIIILTVTAVGGIVYGYIELKMMAHMQARLGPMDAGGFHGWAQLIAIGVSFFQKEDLIPDRADRPLYKISPLIVLTSMILLYVTIPLSPVAIVEDLDPGIFFALAVAGISTIGLLLAGWSAGNKYSLMGALRATGQAIAYELPLVLSVVGVVIQAGTTSMQGIVVAQSQPLFHLGDFAVRLPWGVSTQIIGFGIFVVSIMAELNRAPFDMPVAESELVTGPFTEYSGFRFLFFFLAEYASLVAFAAIGAAVFLGGWYLPGIDAGDSIFKWIGPLIFIAKASLIALFLFWVRITWPRLKEDQLQGLCWKILIPLALVNIGVTGVLKVVF
jgi:NADH-quinone oxidoreductase subunit H